MTLALAVRNHVGRLQCGGRSQLFTPSNFQQNCSGPCLWLFPPPPLPHREHAPNTGSLGKEATPKLQYWVCFSFSHLCLLMGEVHPLGSEITSNIQVELLSHCCGPDMFLFRISPVWPCLHSFPGSIWTLTSSLCSASPFLSSTASALHCPKHAIPGYFVYALSLSEISAL